MGRSNSPYERKPDFIDASFIHTGKYQLSIYLQLLNPKTISGLYFEACDDFLHPDFLSSIAEEVAMKKVDILEKLVKEKSREYDFKGEVFPLVVLGLFKIIDEITGRNLEQDLELAGAGKIVYRCFGVTETQILSTLEEADEPSLKLITDETMAGGGCGTCLKDLKTLLAYHHPEKDQILASKGLSEIEFAKKLGQLLSENNSSFELARVIGTEAWFKTDKLNPWPELERLQKICSERISVPLRFHLFK